MNKIVNVLLMGSVLTLAACGGDSDSSGGSSSDSTPPQFRGLPNCAIVDNNIVVERFGQGCLVKRSNINNGKTFSLSCQDFTLPGGPVNARFQIRTTEDGDIDAIGKDIETFGKYSYTCKSSSPSQSLIPRS